MGKLYAIADLHLSYPFNREALDKIQDVYQDDGLILAGDIGESLDHLREAFRWATSHFARVWWCPGNHELYTLPGDPPKSALAEISVTTTMEQKKAERALRGQAKYDACVAAARAQGVLTPEDPFEVWEADEYLSSHGWHRKRAVVCPIFTLYDYSFRPGDVTREKALDWALEENVQATDEVLLHPDPFPTRDAWCEALVSRFEAKLEATVNQHGPEVPLVIVNHWPLTEKVCLLPLIPRFSLWCGTRRTADWHTRFGAEVVVSGHLHIRRTDVVDGARFEECSLGYPRQWQESGKDINSFFREILPGPPGQHPAATQGTIWRRHGGN